MNNYNIGDVINLRGSIGSRGEVGGGVERGR